MSPEEQQALDAQLCLAARQGDVAKLEQLQAEGASIDAEEGNGFTALMCATSAGESRRDISRSFSTSASSRF